MSIYIPKGGRSITSSNIRDYLANYLVEYQQIPFSPQEKEVLSDAMYEKVLDDHFRPFFYYHMVPLFYKAVSAAFSTSNAPTIIEIGCGSGAASLLFSMLGAKVIGIDLDPHLIGACRKRQEYYEDICGKLDVTFHLADAFKFDYESVAPIDFVYSLFAFNLMQPSTTLLTLIVPHVRSGGRILISDGNKRSIYNRIFRPRDVPKPAEIRALLVRRDFHVRYLEYDCIMPPLFVRNRALFSAGNKIEAILNALGLMRWLGISYTIEAEKNG